MITEAWIEFGTGQAIEIDNEEVTKAMAVTIRAPQAPSMTLREAMNRFMDEAFSNPWRSFLWNDTAASGVYGFPVDIYENAEAYVVTAALPGVNPEAVDITALNGTLTISCEIKPMVSGDYQPLYREMAFGQFRRDIRLPGEFSYEQAEAVYQAGILTLTLPKAEHLKPKSLKVKVAQ
jgi:HSP20 family protein